MRDVPIIPMGEDPGGLNSLGEPTPGPWQTMRRLSSTRGLGGRLLDGAERFLGEAGFDRAPWLTVAFAAGIASWFVLKTPFQCIAAVGTALLIAIAGVVCGDGVDCFVLLCVGIDKARSKDRSLRQLLQG